MKTQAFSRIQCLAAIALVGGFFLPWFTRADMLQVISVSGYQVCDLLRQQANKVLDDDAKHSDTGARQMVLTPSEESLRQTKLSSAIVDRALSYLLYAIPGIAALAVLLEIGSAPRLVKQTAYAFSGLVAIWLLRFMSLQENDPDKLLQQASIGFWVTSAATALSVLGVLLNLIFCSPRKQKEVAVAVAVDPGTATTKAT